MFDWFWDLPLLQTLQDWADQTRAAIDPLYLITGIVALGLLVIWWLNRPLTIRERRTMGGHYLGKITPKTLNKMLDLPDPEEDVFEEEPRERPRRDPEVPEPDVRSGPGADDALRRLRQKRQKEPPRRGR